MNTQAHVLGGCSDKEITMMKGRGPPSVGGVCSFKWVGQEVLLE